MLEDTTTPRSSGLPRNIRPDRIMPSRRITVGSLTIVLVAGYVLLGSALYVTFHAGPYLPRLLEPTLWRVVIYLAPFSFAGLLLYYRLGARTEYRTPVTDFREGWRTAWRDARRGAFAAHRLRFAVVTMLVAPLFFNAFAAWKSLIPLIHPFSMDPFLAHLDTLIHGGQPERLLTWLPLRVIDRIYFFGWGELLILALVVLAWRGEARLLLAFVLTWILLGTAVAMAVSSAGPPYFLALTGRANYAGLLDHLATAKDGPLLALQIQRNLWVAYRERVIVPAAGISAFPSMHVAVPALLTIATWGRSRLLTILLAAFTGVILLSSVALGWHYAVDGYAAIAGAAVIWLSVRRLALTT